MPTIAVDTGPKTEPVTGPDTEQHDIFDLDLREVVEALPDGDPRWPQRHGHQAHGARTHGPQTHEPQTSSQRTHGPRMHWPQSLTCADCQTFGSLCSP
jgi:hypothetical protein